MLFFFFCKQKTAYEIRIRDWSSDVCSSDLDFFTDAVPQRVGDQSALLRDVALGEACGGRSGCFPASIAGAFRLNIGLRQTLFDKRINKERQRVAKEKSVSVRVNLGGRRSNKKKKTIDILTTKKMKI